MAIEVITAVLVLVLGIASLVALDLGILGAIRNVQQPLQPTTHRRTDEQ